MIFMINSLENGGAEKVILTLCKELAKTEKNLKLICLEENRFYEIPQNIEIIFLSDSKGKNSNIKKLLFIPLLAWKLSRYIKKNNIKLIQSHLNRANYVNLLSKIFGANHETQIVIHGIVSRYRKKRFIGLINLLLIKILYPQANLIITISKAMKSDLIKSIKSSNKIIVINNLYDINYITTSMKDKIDDFTFDKSKFYIISVGRLIKLKRNKDIISVLQFLPSNIELIILGEGEEKENLIKYVKKLKLDKRVHLLGRKQNPYKYMSRCDLFVNCSENEGFPNVLIESMACGLPVISSDCLSGPREILAPKSNVNFQLKHDIEEAEYGILYPVGDIESLIKAVKTMLNNENLRNLYIKKGKKRAYDFSIDSIIKQYKKVLNV